MGLPFTQAFHPGSIIPVATPPNASHDSRQSGIIVSMSVVIVLVTLITGSRLYLRCFRKELKWGPDDWVIILGLIGVLAWCSVTLAQATFGKAGRHMYDLTYIEFDELLSLLGISETLFFVTTGVIKISITLFNRRLTGLTSRRWMIAHNTFLGVLVCYILVVIFAHIWACNPAVFAFHLYILGASKVPHHYINTQHVLIPLSVFHIVSDFALLSVPVIVLCKMQMTLSKKIRILLLFSVGAVATIGAVMRQVVQTTQQSDLVYEFPDFVRWPIIDLFFAITAAFLPVLNALIPSHWLGTSSKLSPPRTPTSWEKSASNRSGSDVPETRLHDDEEKGGFRMSTAIPVSPVGKQPDWDEYYSHMQMPGAARK